MSQKGHQFFSSVCSETQILWIFTDVPLVTSPPAASTSLATFSFCMTTQEPPVSLAGLASISPFLWLQQAYPSSACKFTGMILHSTCGGFPKRHHQQSSLLPSLWTKVHSKLTPCMSLKDWYCLDLILKGEASHGNTCNITECWNKIPLVSLLIHSQFVVVVFVVVRVCFVFLKCIVAHCKALLFSSSFSGICCESRLSLLQVIHCNWKKRKNAGIVFGIHWHLWCMYVYSAYVLVLSDSSREFLSRCMRTNRKILVSSPSYECL